MATSPQPAADPSASRGRAPGEMTLMEHLLELRTRITWVAISVVIGMSVFFVPKIGFAVIEFLMRPATHGNASFHAQAITPMENVVVYFRVALLGGISIAMPMIVYQSLRFVGPALTRTEKMWVYPIALGATVAFAAGLAFGYLVVLPPSYQFLFNFGTEYATATPTISSYMDLTTRLLLLMGIIFETPLFVMGLAKLRVVRARQLLRLWRIAIVGAFVISAIATPTIDPVTQSLVAGPLILLYFVGVGLAWLVRRD